MMRVSVWRYNHVGFIVAVLTVGTVGPEKDSFQFVPVVRKSQSSGGVNYTSRTFAKM